MADVPELEPVDTGQCQCETKSYDPFIMGGFCNKVIRCAAEPTTVVTESDPDSIGQEGAMSLCIKHLLIFVNEQGKDIIKYRLQSISDWQRDQDNNLEKVG